MEDSQIVSLYWERNETAIQHTDKKYGRYLGKIAFQILNDKSDSEESVNDTYLAAWDSIPPQRPNVLSTYLGKLTRRISIDRWRKLSADKRGGGCVPLALDELSECVPGNTDPAAEVEAKELAKPVGLFLETLSGTERSIFLKRYFELMKIQQIAESYGMSVSKVKSMLHRIRLKLRDHLQKEGY